MTRYCNDEKFNRSVTTLSKSWAILIILTLACVSSAMATIKMVIFNTITKDIMNLGGPQNFHKLLSQVNIFFTSVHYFMGFLLAWDVTYILQTIVSYPIPSFYKNDRLRDHYCSTNPFNVTKLNSKLLELDRDSRGSFPSFYMCALTYTTTHFFLFLYYTDNAKSFAAKTVFLMIPGLISCSYGVLLWRTNNNHPEDIVGGCFVGMLVAYFVVSFLNFVTLIEFNRILNRPMTLLPATVTTTSGIILFPLSFRGKSKWDGLLPAKFQRLAIELLVMSTQSIYIRTMALMNPHLQQPRNWINPHRTGVSKPYTHILIIQC